MDRNKSKGKGYLTEKDLNDWPLWARNEEDDLIYPVLEPEDFPETNQLYIRTEFTTVSEKIFKGYIVGVQNIYCIAIVWKDELLLFNRNDLDDCLEEIDRMNLDLDVKIEYEEFSPLKYHTTINLEQYSELSGEFDIFKEPTNAERLPGIWAGDD